MRGQVHAYLADVDVVGGAETHVQLGEHVEDRVAELAVLDERHAHLESVRQHPWNVVLNTKRRKRFI